MEHRNIYEQSHKNEKGLITGISITLVGALLVGAGLVARNVKLKKDKQEANSMVNPEITTVTPAMSELVLTEDFDINNPDAVAKRAQAIYDLSEKEYTVLDIKNMIYLLNEMYDKITFPENVKTNDQKYNYFHDVLLFTLGSILSDYVADYDVSLQQLLDDGTLAFSGNTGSVPCAYMFMPTDSDAKKLAIEIAKVYYEQRTNIRNGNKAAMTITANDYYNLFEKAKKLNLKSGNKVLVFQQFGATKPIFTPFLSEKYAEEIDTVSRSVATVIGKLFGAAAEDLDLPADNLKNCDESIEKLEEKYRSENLAAAKKIVESANASIHDETKVVNQGGGKVSGSKGKQEVIQGEVTTKVTTSEFVVEIPNEGTSSDFVPGGNVVEENTTQPSTTSPSTKPTETTTYADSDDDIPVMDDKEFFGKATDEDIKDYWGASVGGLGASLFFTESLGTSFKKKRKK